MGASGNPMGEWSPTAHEEWLPPKTVDPIDPVSHISTYEYATPTLDTMRDFVVETNLHDWGLALANLEEAHEELCRVYDRSGFVVVGEALERIRTTIYMLTGQ